MRPSVVHIQAARKRISTKEESHYRNLDESLPVEEIGSGTIIKAADNYYVLTNRHVVRDAAETDIQIQLWDGQIIFPSKVYADASTDIALLAIRAERLTAARLGDSDKTAVGDLVLAFGSPFGLNHSVTMGIISAMGRRDLQLGTEDLRIQDFIQTDAAINPGNSGGPLLNLRGEVIAVNTAIAGNSGGNDGIAFSIPINIAKHVARHLIKSGHVPKPYLGLRLSPTFGGHDTQRVHDQRFCGAQVLSVTRDSPADEAGLQSGDIILQYNSAYVEDDSHFVNLVGLSPLGMESILTVQRDGQSVEPGPALEELFLRVATVTCDFYMREMPADGIPYWDTGAPGLRDLPHYQDQAADPLNDYEPVDSSSAAIACQGFLRLGHWLEDCGETESAAKYRQAGLTILRRLLGDPYFSSDMAHQGLLLHSVYHRPRGWDHIPTGARSPRGESCMWGDYHLLEAGLVVHRLWKKLPYYTFYGPG